MHRSTQSPQLLDWRNPSVQNAVLDLRGASYAHSVSRICAADELDRSAEHYGIFEGSMLIAAGRLDMFATFQDIPYRDRIEHLGIAALQSPFGALSRLVVHPSARGRGISHVLVSRRIERAREKRIKTLLGVTLLKHRSENLKKFGFEVVGLGLPVDRGPFAGSCEAPTVLVKRQ